MTNLSCSFNYINLRLNHDNSILIKMADIAGVVTGVISIIGSLCKWSYEEVTKKQ